MLASIFLAKLCGEQKPTEITEWIKLRRKQLMTAFQCQRQTAPPLNTIRRIMEDAVIAEEMHQILRTFLYKEYGGQQSMLIVLDGKTMRGTIPKGETREIHLLIQFEFAEKAFDHCIVIAVVTTAQAEQDLLLQHQALKRKFVYWQPRSL